MASRSPADLHAYDPFSPPSYFLSQRAANSSIPVSTLPNIRQQSLLRDLTDNSEDDEDIILGSLPNLQIQSTKQSSLDNARPVKEHKKEENTRQEAQLPQIQTNQGITLDQFEKSMILKVTEEFYTMKTAFKCEFEKSFAIEETNPTFLTLDMFTKDLSSDISAITCDILKVDQIPSNNLENASVLEFDPITALIKQKSEKNTLSTQAYTDRMKILASSVETALSTFEHLYSSLAQKAERHRSHPSLSHPSQWETDMRSKRIMLQREEAEKMHSALANELEETENRINTLFETQRSMDEAERLKVLDIQDALAHEIESLLDIDCQPITKEESAAVISSLAVLLADLKEDTENIEIQIEKYFKRSSRRVKSARTESSALSFSSLF